MKKDLYAIPYTIFKTFWKPFFWFRFRPVVINKGNIPEKGPIIICWNHRHHFDPFCAMQITRRMIHFLAKKELMDGTDALVDKPNTFVRRLNALLLKCVGTISVDRGGDTAEAMGDTMDYLGRGSAIGISPEGTRNKTANEYELQPFKFGAVSLAQKTGALLVPLGITGKYVKNGNLIIRVGEPFRIGGMTLENANNLLRDRIQTLINISRQEEND